MGFVAHRELQCLPETVCAGNEWTINWRLCYWSHMHKSARHPTILPGIDAISIKSDRTFPRHSHDEFGFGYVAGGGQESWSGRGLVEAEAGDTLTVNPAEIHDGIGRKGQPRHWRMLFLSQTALASLSGVPPGSAEFSRPVNRSRHALKLTIDAIAAVSRETPDRDQAEQLVMLALAAQLDPNSGAHVLTRSERSTDVQTVLDMIRDAWDAPLSLDDFAAATQSSKFRVLRSFSRELGTTPHAYLTQHRVKRAKDMILAGSSLAETAIACGFSDQSHLTRAFSRQLGLTPGSFARSARH